MKAILYISIAIGGIIGSYTPVWFGDSNPFSGWSLLCGTLGSAAGLWLGYKLYKYYEY